MYVVNRENDNLSVNKGILALEKGNYGQCNKFKAYVSVRIRFNLVLFEALLIFNRNALHLGLRWRQTESDCDRVTVPCAELLQFANQFANAHTDAQ